MPRQKWRKVLCQGSLLSSYIFSLRTWAENKIEYNILLKVEDCLAKSRNMFLGWPNVCMHWHNLNTSWFVNVVVFTGVFPTQLERLLITGTLRIIVPTERWWIPFEGWCFRFLDLHRLSGKGIWMRDQIIDHSPPSWPQLGEKRNSWPFLGHLLSYARVFRDWSLIRIVSAAKCLKANL